MKRFLIAFFASVLLMFSCTGGRTQQSEEPAADSLADTVVVSPFDSLEQLLVETPTPKAMDELFDDFFFNFAANKRLQRDRVIFPLTVNKAGEKQLVEKEAWQMERFFMRQGYYTLMFDNDEQMRLMKDTSITQAVVEKIHLRKNIVKDYVFNRIRGAWMLREINEMPIAENVNASFIQFYQHFAVDKAFQTKSLNATVTFVGPDPDDELSTMEGLITADTWEAFAPQLPSKMIYNIIYGEQKVADKEKIFILRGVANGLEMELRFKKVHNRWLLMKMTT